MNIQKIPKYQVLLLAGAGHANIQVLKHLTMRNYEGLQTILIDKGYSSLYSGMAPGMIENYYKFEDSSIDIPKICKNSETIFINDEIIKLDEKKNYIYLKNHPPIKYNVLSLNVGSKSKINKLKISKKAKIIKVKPIINLHNRITLIEDLIKKKEFVSCSIIGGGVAGIEIAFALKSRFKNNIKITVFSNRKHLENSINSQSLNKILKLLNEHSINFINSEITSIQDEYIEDKNNNKYPSNISFISTGAMSLTWVVNSDLNLDEEGFIKVNRYLQSENYRNIFATGDIASLNYADRPKSGVMAVRQGEQLKKNIFKFLLNKNLSAFKPQSHWLYLIGTGNQNAVLNWRNISINGNLVWKLKEFIDRRFIEKFSFKGPMINLKKKIRLPLSIKVQNQINLKMRCEGCGSKLSKNYLLSYLSNSNNKNLEILPDSASINLPDKELVQSIDHIKYFNDMNPYVFGRIAYLHSQNDILSSGSKVNSFSVSLGLPHYEDLAQKFYLEFFMKGIIHESENDKSLLASGHTYTSDEPGITLNMNGTKILATAKDQARDNDLIYLTKPLGVGFLMSAFVNNAKGVTSHVYEKLLKNMLISNKKAYEISNNYNGKALTDISGFGLAAHLIDICLNSNLTANLILNKKLIIAECLNELGLFESSAYEDNKQSSINHIKIISEQKLNILNLSKILFDPQTSGPLLISINSDQKEAFENEFDQHYSFKPILIGKFQTKKEFAIEIN
ncbi:selenide, water dikinase SelD [Alphaproteobacteria bacterium]|nr:selenide, water dikinase SelD [Alphaproteobacteria bacterium]